MAIDKGPETAGSRIPAEDDTRQDDLTLWRITRAAGLVTAAIAGLGLISLPAGITTFTSILPGYTEIVISTALIWLFLGLILATYAIRLPRGRRAHAVQAVLAGIAIIEAIEFVFSLMGSHSIVEIYFIQVSNALLGHSTTPISPASSALIILASLALFILLAPGRTQKHKQRILDAVGITGLAIVLISFTFVLSYWYGAPFLYKTSLTPISLPSALAGLFTGVGLIAAAGPRAIPMKYFSGRSTRSRLLRVFVPLIILFTLAQTLIFAIITDLLDVQNALLLSICIVIFVIITVGVIIRFSDRIGRDLEEAEEALQVSEERYRAIFSESPIAVELYDVSGALVHANPASIHLFGVVDPRELTGFNLFIDPNLADEHKERLRRGETVRYQAPFDFEKRAMPNLYHTMRTGIIWVDVQITPLERSIGGYLMQVQEITERKLAEESLRKANRQLNLMTSITRHDINNKIMVILGYLSIAEAKFTDPVLGEYLRKMEAATKEIQSQIEFTKVYQDLGNHEPLWQNLDLVLSHVPVPETITLSSDVRNIDVYADPLLERVFFNLLDNSMRHGQHVTKIRVSSTRIGDRLRIVWEDDGAGVAGAEKEKIFERGFGKNTGLGLFLVREILSQTSISIQETGEYGKGARFEMMVPKEAWHCAGT